MPSQLFISECLLFYYMLPIPIWKELIYLFSSIPYSHHCGERTTGCSIILLMPPGGPRSALFWRVKRNLLFSKVVNVWASRRSLQTLFQRIKIWMLEIPSSPHTPTTAVVFWQWTEHKPSKTIRERNYSIFDLLKMQAYSWSHLTALDLSGLLNTHLQHLEQLLTSGKRGRATNMQMCTQDPRGEKGWQQWRQGWGGGEARSVLGDKHTNPPVHSLGGSEGCMALLGVPLLYKILMVGFWIWEQRTGHHDELRGKIKEQKKLTY